VGKLLRRSDGAVATEFVIVLPLFLAFVLGITSAGLAWFTNLNLSQAARESARLAAVIPSTPDLATDTILDAAEQRAFDAFGGDVDYLCVAYLGLAPVLGAEDIENNVRVVVANAGYGPSGDGCFDDGRDEEERRVQVVIGRERPLEWFIGSSDGALRLRGTAAARYEAARPEAPAGGSP
jgi:hypothetical protein